MAEALLRRHPGTSAGSTARVSSAGLLSDGQPATDTAVDTMAEPGPRHLRPPQPPHQLRACSSRADLIVAMAREHVREAVVLRPDRYRRTFTLKELVRRGRRGSRAPGEALEDWLARLHDGAAPLDHLGASPVDDVADPVGQGPHVYERTAAELDDLTTRLVDLLWPPAV